MKIFFRIWIGGALIAWGLSSIASAQVEVGDTREDVNRKLGEPSGYAEANGVEAYTFDRGRVLMRNGQVISHSIVSEEDARTEREEANRQQEERLAEGNELRDRVTGDSAFQERPARDRLAFWEALRQRYPQVDTGIDHAMAAQQVEMEERQQVREMELRLMEEEKKAELAQKHAPQQRQFYGSGWPLVFGDTVHSSAFPDRGLFGDRFTGDQDRLTIPVRRPAPDPITARERFMPLQEYGQPAARSDVRHGRGHGHGHRHSGAK